MKSLISNNTAKASLSLAIIALIALVYWPVHQAGFVWDDKICLHNTGWLWVGNGWKQLIFRDFYEWTNYFRPLIVAFFALEVRVFDVAPGPMHLVSLAMHLVNTLLVGLVATTLLDHRAVSTKPAIWLVAIAMLIYGLHPALIEPVVWISCQFELAVTCFMLLGLLSNMTIQRKGCRAVVVAICFFLAACAKEAAISMPLLLVVFDWIRQSPQPLMTGPLARLRALWRRQWLVYLCVLLAGFSYLAFRYYALGYLLQHSGGESLFSFARLQMVSFLYLSYLRIILWPMVGLGPIHEVDIHQFARLGGAAIATDFAALTIFLSGSYFAWKRNPVGVLIMAVTVALLPVLHLVPVDFDISLYHERYAMTAVAMACALLPLCMSHIAVSTGKLQRVGVVATLIIMVWLTLAIVNIRVTLPLWSNETKLWLWALEEHPESLVAKDHLLSTYLELDDRPHARLIANEIMADTRPCPICMVNIANLAMVDGDLTRATIALERAKHTIPLLAPTSMLQAYVLAMGLLFEMKNEVKDAEDAYHAAISMEPLDPQAQMTFALFLVRQGKVVEARRQEEHALALTAPDQRNNEHQRFERILQASLKLHEWQIHQRQDGTH